MDKIYLDACCVNRPFDNQLQERVRLESEAVLLVLKRVREGQCEWIGSAVLDFETSQIPDPERKRRVQAVLALVLSSIVPESKELSRASELKSAGIHAVDALHLACAEAASCNVFLTTDDAMLRAARRNASDLKVRVLNPTDWLREASPL